MKVLRIRAVLKSLGLSPMGQGKRRNRLNKLYVNKEGRFAYVYNERDRYNIASKEDKEEAREYLFKAGKE